MSLLRFLFYNFPLIILGLLLPLSYVRGFGQLSLLSNPTPTELELALSILTNKYHSLFDPTQHTSHITSVQPILTRPHLPIFAESWELCGLYVSRSYQRRGLGTLLLQRGLDQASAERVPVTVRSSPSGMYLYEGKGLRAYEKLGFERFFDTGEKGVRGLVWEPAGMEGRWFESAREKAGEYEEREKERKGKGLDAGKG
jgi:GNAT superfamily N-acetyltransferase